MYLNSEIKMLLNISPNTDTTCYLSKICADASIRANG